MADTWPRATTILKDLGFIQDAFYFQEKHRRRGRYVDFWANEIGMSGPGPDADWYARSSGDPEQKDEIAHEECRPYIDAYLKAKAEIGFTMTHCAIEVRNSVCRYIGHIDQVWERERCQPSLIDIKTGGESDWHKYQLALYQPAVMETLGLYTRRYNLYLTNDGKYRLVERKEHRDLSEATILAQAWHIMHGRNGK